MKTCLTIIIMLALISCNQQKENFDPKEIEQLIQSVNGSSLQGHVNQRVEQIIAVYAADAVLFPPGGVKPISGTNAIQEYYAEGLSSSSRVLTITTSNLKFDVIDSTHAVQAGKYTMSLLTTEGDTTNYNGEMLIYWKKLDHGWKIQLDMWH